MSSAYLILWHSWWIIVSHLKHLNTCQIQCILFTTCTVPCRDSAVRWVVFRSLFVGVCLSVCLCDNSWTVWDISMKLYVSKIWLNTRISSKMAATRCTAAHGWWLNVSDVPLGILLPILHTKHSFHLSCNSESRVYKDDVWNWQLF